MVLSKDAEDALKMYDVPVVRLDDSPGLFLHLDSSIKNTVEFLNKNAKVVLFYELFDFPKLHNLKRPKKVFLTHGNMLKSYMTSNKHRIKMFRNYDYMVALSPYLKRQFIEDDKIPAKKLLDLGIARVDDVIRHAGKIVGKKKICEAVGLNPSLPLFSYMPTFWGASSVYHIGKELARNFPEGYNLAFRPHPQTPPAVIAEYEEIIKTKPNIRYIPDGFSKDIDMLALFNASSAIIGDVSSVMLEAILVDKPLIFAQVTGREEQEEKDLESIKELVQYAGILDADTVRDLPFMLENVLSRGINEEIWSMIKARTFFHYDGTSVQSIGDFILDLV